MFKFEKYADNPILAPNPDVPWEALCVLNPAVIYDESNEEFVMIYRAAGHDVKHKIRLGLATSKDGIHFTRQSNQPIWEGRDDEPDSGCIEDPRLMKIGDLYYLTYAARAYGPGQYWLPNRPNPRTDKDLAADELPTLAK